MKELVNKIAIFFGGEDFYEKGEEARLEFSPSELREINSLIIENSRLKVKLKNTNWHTNTPTEEGWYVCKMIGIDLYETQYFTGVNWNKETIEKWQKIEETSR